MWKFIFKASFGILIFVFFAWKAGPVDIIKNLSQFKLIALFFLNLTTIGGILLGGTGVIILGKRINPDLKWREGIKGFLATMSFALFLPGRAGDLTLPFYWKRFMLFGECLSIILMDKLITVFWIFVLGSCGVYVVYKSYIGIVISLILFLSIILIFSLFSIPRTRLFVIKKLPSKIFDFLEGSMTGLRTIACKGKKNIFIVFFLTFLRLIVYGLGLWVSLWGLDILVSIVYSILVIAIAQFTTFIPISIMGFGPVEAVCVFSFEQINIDPSNVIAALLAGRLVTLFWLSLFFCLFSINK